MSTQVIRVPDGLYKRVRMVSAVAGIAPGQLLYDAFEEYITSHAADFQQSFEEAQKYALSGDVEGMLNHSEPERLLRASEAARNAR